MDLFTEIPDALAIVSLPKGVVKQVQLYHRGKRLYVPHGGGYVELRAKELFNGGETHVTTHPNVRVTDVDWTSFSWHLEKGVGSIPRYGEK